MTLVLQTPPTAEPISAAEARNHLRVASGNEDPTIDGYLKAAREQVEAYTDRVLMPQTWIYTVEAFPEHGRPLILPKTPVLAVESVRYLSATGGVDTLLAASDYVVTIPVGPHSEPGHIRMKSSLAWPSVMTDTDAAATIIFQAGYATAAEVPWALKQAILLLLSGMYDGPALAIHENPALVALLSPFRLIGF